MAQELLRESWLRGQHGRLCAWEQAKALALREASRELHGRTQLAWIAARVEKVGGGHPNLGRGTRWHGSATGTLQAKRMEL